MKTVKIVKANAAGYATINESDFDPARHVLYGAPVAEQPEPAKPKKGKR